jgi:predicted RNase H-like HicB family nuclease
MAKRHYLGVIERGTLGYGIYFPDFPGCISGGDTLDHVVAMGMEALQFHIDGMVEDGDLIPEPGDVDLDAERAEVPEADLHGLAAIPVTVPTFPQTVEVPIDTALVQEIDRSFPNRRQFIMDATRRELARLQKSA